MGEKEGDMMPERIFPYGDNHFTLNGLLEKPEVLSYLRRKSVEKNRMLFARDFIRAYATVALPRRSLRSTYED